MRDNMLFFGIRPSGLDKKLKNKLAQIARLKEVVKPIICLPDIHLKGSMEAPSSLAVATDKAIELKFSSASLNCGMGVILTDLKERELTEDFLDHFFKNISPSPFKIILRKLGFKDRYDLNKKEIRKAVLEGAKTSVLKFKLDKEAIKKMENRGKVESVKISSNELSKLLPSAALKREVLGFGSAFYGNHFIEIQIVDKIISKKYAKKWGLKKGQVVVMYHGGGGKVPYVLGRYYSSRLKGSKITKIKQFFGKLYFHFIKNGFSDANSKWNLYFNKKIDPVMLNSDQGKKILKTTQLAMNYGYAFRAATIARVRDIMNSFFRQKRKYSLLYDISHNSIQQQAIKGKKLWIHRHNATRIMPEKPIILSGYNNTSSYLCVGTKNAEKALYTIDHGAGETIKKFRKQVLAGRSTKLYTHTFFSEKSKRVNHITDKGIDYVVDTFKSKKMLSAVAKLRPIAGIKN